VHMEHDLYSWGGGFQFYCTYISYALYFIFVTDDTLSIWVPLEDVPLLDLTTQPSKVITIPESSPNITSLENITSSIKIQFSL
jgi:hypothetical protein